jgi:hypothetical protein
MSWQHTSLLCGCAVHGGEGNFPYILTYLLQLSCHSVAVVLTIVQTKQTGINIHKRNYTKHSTNSTKHNIHKYVHILPKHPHIFPVVFLEQSALEESENLLATPGVFLLRHWMPRMSSKRTVHNTGKTRQPYLIASPAPWLTVSDVRKRILSTGEGALPTGLQTGKMD